MVRVIFLHPDLGIGGAERLIVDCCIALQARGHTTTIVTAHHDHSHCFAETLPGGPCKVVSQGDWLPRSILGRCQALFASIRMLYITLYCILFIKSDVVIVDQVSTPLLLLSGHPTIFYCHYPDLLLSTGRSGLKSLYRVPLDWLEQFTTGLAGTVLVNSQFTCGVFRQTFTRLSSVIPDVLYPSLATHMFDVVGVRPSLVDQAEEVVTFLSINRYERKKNIGLAIKALALLPPAMAAKSRLLVAGGYDSRVKENLEHYQQLVELAKCKGVEDRVVFLKSPSDEEKVWLLRNSDCLVYTPAGEHFGIVPLESMYCGTPVMAVNNGGPVETVVHGETGWLSDQDDLKFSRVMENVIGMDKGQLKVMGEAGRRRVEQFFSFEAFSKNLESHTLEALVKYHRNKESDENTGFWSSLLAKFAVTFHFFLAMGVLYWMVFTPVP